MIKGVIEIHPECVVVAVDVMNCYNEQRIGATVEVLQKSPALSHLTTTLAPVPVRAYKTRLSHPSVISV